MNLIEENGLEDLRADLKRQGYALLKYDDGPIHSYPYDSPWITDIAFSLLYNKIRQNTLVDRPRCYSLYLLANQVQGVAGDFLEVGTWRGGTAGLLARCAPDRTLYVADTFEGVVKSSEWEHYEDRAHDDTSVNIVEKLLRETLATDNFKILHGIFPEQTGCDLPDRPLALVYLDLDVYRSTKDAFNYIWPRVAPGGVVVFDDYGMVSACEGISRFVDEVRTDSDKLFIQNLNGQACIVKSQVA